MLYFMFVNLFHQKDKYSHFTLHNYINLEDNYTLS